ncbi:GNAT family N-acetyltransferase [Oryzihumus leptocrescens]|uniref:Acetyltransferase (GNAT) family protein n=1 Tax=Oryzihumus leptocrescens TaxID=297536 RepID=A0A542ZIF6_9MICO|nr:GNAT family protein [Oryzihumus leptocrescens]TQL60079.1 acetyltransferase (GNAT) family protein [Oryzihumus leptocrescens]
MPVSLTSLTADLAATYTEVLRRNASHLNLTPSERDRTPEEHAAAWADPAEGNIRFAVLLDGRLIGRVDLDPVNPPKYSIGYWIDADHTGRGHATTAVALAVEHALDELGATDVYAGVTHGNHTSVAVLHRNGFTRVADLGTYERFHLPLDGGPPRNP